MSPFRPLLSLPLAYLLVNRPLRYVFARDSRRPWRLTYGFLFDRLGCSALRSVPVTEVHRYYGLG